MRVDDFTSEDVAAILGGGGGSFRRTVGGSESIIWKIERAGAASLALKIYRAPLHAKELGAVERELAFLRTLASYSFPCPRAMKCGAHRGHCYLLQEWIDGCSLADFALRNPQQFESSARDCGRWHAKLHALPLDAFEPRPTKTWLERAGDVELGERLDIEARNDAFCHFDLHPMNLIVGDDGRLRACIDFGIAGVADRRADLAVTQAVMNLAPKLLGLPDTDLDDFWTPFMEAWRAGYAEQAGSFPAIDLFLEWATKYATGRAVLR